MQELLVTVREHVASFHMRAATTWLLPFYKVPTTTLHCYWLGLHAQERP